MHPSARYMSPVDTGLTTHHVQGTVSCDHSNNTQPSSHFWMSVLPRRATGRSLGDLCPDEIRTIVLFLPCMLDVHRLALTCTAMYKSVARFRAAVVRRLVARTLRGCHFPAPLIPGAFIGDVYRNVLRRTPTSGVFIDVRVSRSHLQDWREWLHNRACRIVMTHVCGKAFCEDWAEAYYHRDAPKVFGMHRSACEVARVPPVAFEWIGGTYVGGQHIRLVTDSEDDWVTAAGGMCVGDPRWEIQCP